MAREQDEQTATAHKLVAAAEALLGVQLYFITDEFDRLPPAASDNFSLGYVAGFLDAMMQRAGVEDETVSFAMVSILMMTLFGKEDGASYAGRFLNGQHLSETRRGLMAGGTDALAYLTNPNQLPRGWHHHCS
jgi:hypothetical protein